MFNKYINQKIAATLNDIIKEVYQSQKTIEPNKNIVPKISKDGLDENGIIRIWKLIAEHSTHLSSAKMFGHMDTAPHPIAVYTDALISALNNNLLFRELSPFASDVETYMCSYISSCLGLPNEMQGMFCSGGSIANNALRFAIDPPEQNIPCLMKCRECFVLEDL